MGRFAHLVNFEEGIESLELYIGFLQECPLGIVRKENGMKKGKREKW